MKIIVTGGAGFVGSHLCEFLLEKKHEVVCVDNLLTGRKENISHLLKNNIRLNNIENVTLKNAACGGKSPSLLMREGITSYVCPSQHLHDTKKDCLQVKQVCLDDELKDLDVGFIKIDCEGYEYHIIRNAENVIVHKRPVLFVEIHPRLIGLFGHTVNELCDFLSPYYALSFYDLRKKPKKTDRFIRLLSKYMKNRSYSPLSTKRMLRLISTEPVPHQVYMLATPKG